MENKKVASHDHPEYTLKATYKIGLTIISILFCTVSALLLLVFSASAASSERINDVNVSLEKHLSEYGFIKESLGEIRETQKVQVSNFIDVKETLIRQGQKIDDVNDKIDHVYRDISK